MKNVILFFTDQQRYDTISALGNKLIKTPALDQLVRSGTSYSHAYTPSPVCIPARLSMLTGLYAHHTNCNVNKQMPSGLTSFMHVLQQNNYQTHGVGKMHFTFLDDEMFGYENRDTSEEVDNGKPDDYKDYLVENGYGHVKDRHGIRGEMYYIPQPSQLPDQYHNSTWVAKRTIDFLENRDVKRPFFLMSSFIKPHPPFEAPVPFNKLYRAYDMTLPKMCDDYATMQTYWNKKQNRYKGRDSGRDINLLRTMKAYYYAAISHVDYNLGKILAYLEKNDLMDDTMIVFTSDHGEMLGDYNCFGKRCFYDGSVRVPLIVRTSETTEQVCQHNASLVDIFPTILDYTGVSYDGKLDGISLFNITDKKYENRAVFSQFSQGDTGSYMIKKGKQKYFYSAADEKEWFFDEKIDDNEMRNLAYTVSHINNKNELKKQLIDTFECDGCGKYIDHHEFIKYGKKELFKDPDEGLLYQDSLGSIPNIEGYTDE